VFEYAADDCGIVNDSDDAHGVVAFGAFERIHLVDLLDEPGPVGFGFANRWCFVQEDWNIIDNDVSKLDALMADVETYIRAL